MSICEGILHVQGLIHGPKTFHEEVVDTSHSIPPFEQDAQQFQQFLKTVGWNNTYDLKIMPEPISVARVTTPAPKLPLDIQKEVDRRAAERQARETAALTTAVMRAQVVAMSPELLGLNTNNNGARANTTERTTRDNSPGRRQEQPRRQ